MKLNLITLHRVMNYGSVLQTYASQEFLCDCGFDVEIIDYYRKQDLKANDLRTLSTYVDSLKKEGKSKKEILRGIVQYNTNKLQKKKFDEFINKYVVLTQQSFFDYKSLKKLNNSADCFCTGSDQVWNYEYNGGFNPAYYLNFAEPLKRKISLSSSMGCSKIINDVDDVKKSLSQYQFISVREKQTSELLLEMGINNSLLLDPTLLIDAIKWKDLACKRLIDKNYLLVYGFNISKDMIKFAEKIAKQKNLVIVRIGLADYHKAIYKYVFSLPNVNEFLSLFLHCDYVITNSFHGTAFSINFSKNFKVFLRDKYNIRINSLLEMFNIKDALITDVNAQFQINDIDYKIVEEKLVEERLKAKNNFIRIGRE